MLEFKVGKRISSGGERVMDNAFDFALKRSFRPNIKGFRSLSLEIRVPKTPSFWDDYIKNDFVKIKTNFHFHKFV